MSYLNLLREQFNRHVEFRERRPGILQLVAPLYHEDGDMVDIFLQELPSEDGKIRICDYGMALMRLSYSYDLDSENKERIFQKILSENQVMEEDGNLFIDAEPDRLYPAILQFAQTIGKVTNMSLYKREIVRSLFYDDLGVYIHESLGAYHPVEKVTPLPDRDDLEVDYKLNISPSPVFLFGVRDSEKARLATIYCLEFQRAKLRFKSAVIHEDFFSLAKKDQRRITSAADKQFVSLDDFKSNAEQYLSREVSAA